MNKYELALVVSAKIEDDARTATVETLHILQRCQDLPDCAGDWWS